MYIYIYIHIYIYIYIYKMPELMGIASQTRPTPENKD